MNRLPVWITIAVLLLTDLSVASVFYWPSAEDANKTRDCKWGPWQGTTCEKTGKRVFQIFQTRIKFEAKNGGNDCRGRTFRVKPCTMTDFIAESLYRTVNTGTEAGTTDSGKGGFMWSSWSSTDSNQLHKYNPCAERFYDENGGLRIAGKCETVERTRKREDGSTETVEEPAPVITRRRKRNILSTNKRDLLFLIDASGSIGEENLEKEIKLAKTMASKLCDKISIGKNKTRVAVMTFTHKQKPHLNFDDYFEKPEVIKSMDKIKYKGGGTCIIKALDFTRKEMITTVRGARNYEPGTERVVVFITDGCDECEGNSNLLGDLKDMQKHFEDQEIAFISYFVGKADSCTKEILALADGSRCHQYHRADNWAEVDEMTKYIAKQPCMDSWKIGVPCTL
ncbi:matrilin-1-like [Styela clava]